jgi:hypothetical protein
MRAKDHPFQELTLDTQGININTTYFSPSSSDEEEEGTS